MAWWIIGAGSNVLVGDGGVRGAPVIRLAGEFAAAQVRIDDGRVMVDAGGSSQHGVVTNGFGGRGGHRFARRYPWHHRRIVADERRHDARCGEFVREVWVQSPAVVRSPIVPACDTSTGTRHSSVTSSSRAWF